MARARPLSSKTVAIFSPGRHLAENAPAKPAFFKGRIGVGLFHFRDLHQFSVLPHRSGSYSANKLALPNNVV
jgi:hypothetical protein